MYRLIKVKKFNQIFYIIKLYEIIFLIFYCENLKIYDNLIHSLNSQD